MVAHMTKKRIYITQQKAPVCHFSAGVCEPAIAEFHFKVIYDCVVCLTPVYC